MLNQINQFVCIQIRNVGATATGCVIDGLIGMTDGFLAKAEGLSNQAHGFYQLGDSPKAGGKHLIRWRHHSDRFLRHWHLQPTHWQWPQR